MPREHPFTLNLGFEPGHAYVECPSCCELLDAMGIRQGVAVCCAECGHTWKPWMVTIDDPPPRASRFPPHVREYAASAAERMFGRIAPRPSDIIAEGDCVSDCVVSGREQVSNTGRKSRVR